MVDSWRLIKISVFSYIFYRHYKTATKNSPPPNLASQFFRSNITFDHNKLYGFTFQETFNFLSVLWYQNLWILTLRRQVKKIIILFSKIATYSLTAISSQIVIFFFILWILRRLISQILREWSIDPLGINNGYISVN